MTRTEFVRFEGTDGPVAFRNAPGVLALLSDVFLSWPFRVEARASGAPCLEVLGTDGGFAISSPALGAPKSASDPLNAVCTLVAELAWSRLRHEPDLLCFHGAGVVFDSGLVLFPNKRRAGKSTLTGCLAARGHKVFTDDYLPLRIDESGRMSGIANGAAPRLRLPLPEGFSKDLSGWWARHEGPRNRQYLYLNLKRQQLAFHGESLPVSSIVLLNRVDAPTKPRLEPVEAPTVLRRLIHQNFSRSMNPARVLAMICGLVDTCGCLSLTYSNAEEASEFLSCHHMFEAKDTKPWLVGTALPDALPAILSTDKAKLQETAYVRNPTVFLRRYGDDVFLASPDGPGLHHFDGVTNGIWALLADPVTPRQVLDILSAAFPDEPRDQVDGAVREIMRNMVRHRLITPVART